MNKEQTENHLRNLSDPKHIPEAHVTYLNNLKNNFNFFPKVIYDIGACVLQWEQVASKVWPGSKVYAFEVMDSVEFLYKERNLEYYLGVFSNEDNKEITFYQSNISPGGNSYFRENSWATNVYYGKDCERTVKTIKIDTAVKERNFLLPDLIKIDVQGCELDILKGMEKTLRSCKHLIVELQHKNYNNGAPLSKDSIPFIESLGFKLITPRFTETEVDGDYHFEKI